MSASGLPGSLLDANRAGMTTRNRACIEAALLDFLERTQRARLALEAVAQDVGRDAGVARDPRRSLYRAADIAAFQERNAAGLQARAASGEPVYYAMGSADFLYATAAPTRAMLDAQGIAYHYNESDGGHTWINWRRYLTDFLPRLFR